MGGQKNPELTDRLRKETVNYGGNYFDIYDSRYFSGRKHGEIIGYEEYQGCQGILSKWTDILSQLFQPASILDVGAAYGFVVKRSRELGIPAEGIEPSEYARSMSEITLHAGFLPGNLPSLSSFHLVTCTEVLEHLPADLAKQSIDAMAALSLQWLVLLVEVGDWDCYQDDPTHINPRPHSWWRELFEGIENFRLNEEKMKEMNEIPYVRNMRWADRIYVLERDC